MARRARVAPRQLRALDRLKSVRGIGRFNLAGGTAIAFHLGHRRSDDLGLFGPGNASFAPFQALARSDASKVHVISVGDATLHMEVLDVPIDVVRYPYPLLQKPVKGPLGFSVAGLLDLATNKLAAISKRGLRRDFWDLYAVLQSGLSLAEAYRAYLKRFGVAESDLYHVTTALTWFEDAEAEPVAPTGMTKDLWSKIRACFEAEAPLMVLPPRL